MMNPPEMTTIIPYGEHPLAIHAAASSAIVPYGEHPLAIHAAASPFPAAASSVPIVASGLTEDDMARYKLFDAKILERFQTMKSSTDTRTKIKLEEDIHTICFKLKEGIELILKWGIKENDVKAAIFYYKKMGDYMSFAAQVRGGAQKQLNTELAETYYKRAYDIATAEENLVPKSNRLRLLAAISLADLYHEELNDPIRAWDIAVQAFTGCRDELLQIRTFHPENFELIDRILIRLRESFKPGHVVIKIDADGEMIGRIIQVNDALMGRNNQMNDEVNAGGTVDKILGEMVGRLNVGGYFYKVFGENGCFAKAKRIGKKIYQYLSFIQFLDWLDDKILGDKII